MNSLVTVEHPELSVGQLCQEIIEPSSPIKRSTHAGNQTPRELLLMTEFPAGIEILMVDTVQGNDNYTSPRNLILDGERFPLCSKKAAGGRVVGSIAVSDCELPEDLDLVCVPRTGETLLGFHSRALKLLKPVNKPLPMSEIFAQQPDLYRTAIEQTQNLGDIVCRADNIGRIVVCGDEGPNQVGVFGLEDESPTLEGILPTLNAMMAIDMLTSSLVLSSDKTTHLGGRNMASYTRDQVRMLKVGTIIAKTAAELGTLVNAHCYQVVDIRGLDKLVPRATHRSQHQLLRARSVVNVNLAQHFDAPCGSL